MVVSGHLFALSLTPMVSLNFFISNIRITVSVVVGLIPSTYLESSNCMIMKTGEGIQCGAKKFLHLVFRNVNQLLVYL